MENKMKTVEVETWHITLSLVSPAIESNKTAHRNQQGVSESPELWRSMSSVMISVKPSQTLPCGRNWPQEPAIF